MSKWHDGQRRINEAKKYIREKIQPSERYSEVRPCSDVPRGYVPRIRLWPLRRDYHSGIPIGAVGRLRSDWPARVLANDVSRKIDR